MSILDNLNNKQIEAVKALDGPMLILAGAGSGKTKVLTTKIAYLLDERDISPVNILAITFTNKAAKEMKERIYNLIGREAFRLQISTFHSFGLKLLKENYDRLGLDKNFNVLDADDSLTLVKKIMKNFDIDTTKFSPKAVRNVISSNKNEMISPEEYHKFVYTDFDEVAEKIYIEYEKNLRRSSVVDFDDLLILPIELFDENKDILAKYQEQYKYVFIDEYQDTNRPQYILSKMISAKYKNITVVGDADQAIFTWRGADYKNILNFEKDYPNSKMVVLDENYRSTKKILEAANRVIKNNKLRKEKNLWTSNDEGEKIVYYRAFDEMDESNYVIKEIKKLLDEGVSPKDICILYRANAQSRNVEEAFLRNNISYRVVGSFAFYSRKEIKDLVAYLKLINNNKDDVSLLRIINYPKRGIGLKALENLELEASNSNKSLFECLSSGKELEFKNIIEDLSKAKETMSLTDFIDLVLNKSGIKEDLENEKTLEADIRLENLEEFKSITKSVEENDGIVSLSDFLDELSLVSDVNDQKNDSNDERVSLMTIHSVKGLEYDYVFIVGMEEGLFPHINCLESRDELEEERRLAYVAITRAKKKLFIINARSRLLYGKVDSNVPSRFIAEIGDDLFDQIKKDGIIRDTQGTKENRNVEKENDLKPGDVITHEKYGMGVVINIEGPIATISFSKDGVKKILKNHKSISKINN
ncbi:MAG: UvrD-helicase domain-containing protein [Bacilli bacterium]|nr:UvrD-helicase domain-containing protein [Bacilli bacterium]